LILGYFINTITNVWHEQDLPTV